MPTPRFQQLSVSAIFSLTLGAAGEIHARSAFAFCDSIHAARIAVDEGLPNCDTVMPDATTQQAGADLDLSSSNDCDGLTANQCAAFHYVEPGRTTRPGKGAYRLEFPETSKRCSDGTKPHYYIQTGSNAKWIIRHNGSSGKCGVSVDSATNEVTKIGSRCFDVHEAGDGHSGFGAKRKWNGGKGIMEGDPNTNTHFGDWNKVWIPSCSNDQYQGTATSSSRELVKVTEPTQQRLRTYWLAPVYSQGFDIVKDVLGHLASNHGLDQAATVVLYGSSGGAAGLLMTLDGKAEHAATLAPVGAKIVGLLDSRSEPNQHGAEAFRDSSGQSACDSIFGGTCTTAEYDRPPRGTEDLGFRFDTSAWQPNFIGVGRGREYEKVSAWGTPLDASCLAHHKSSYYMCTDGYHVLYHHTETPVFHATSLIDTNQFNNSIAHLAAGENDFCFADFGEDAMRDRVREQLVSYRDYRDQINGAQGDSNGAGPIGVWAVDFPFHEVTKDNCVFGQIELGIRGSGSPGLSLAEAFHDWVENDTAVFLVEGIDGVEKAEKTRQRRCRASRIKGC